MTPSTTICDYEEVLELQAAANKSLFRCSCGGEALILSKSDPFVECQECGNRGPRNPQEFLQEVLEDDAWCDPRLTARLWNAVMAGIPATVPAKPDPWWRRLLRWNVRPTIITDKGGTSRPGVEGKWKL